MTTLPPTPRSTPGPPPGPPPGWYPGPSGLPQWWDGARWWPPTPPADNSVPLALLAHLGPFVGGFLVPLIVLLAEGKRTPFVKHHATEALNFQITTGVASLVLGGLYLVGFVGTFAGVDDGDVRFGAFAVLILVAVIALAVVGIASLVFVILASVRAGQRRFYRYPLSIRFVRGAASRAEIAELERAAGR